MLQPYLIVIVVISCLPYHCRGFSRFHVVDTRRRSWRTRTPCSWNARGVLCERANTRPDERARQHGSVSNWRPSMSVQDMIGADVESGGLFDPLGFSRDEPALFRRRAVELKHGRVAMVAMVGILVQSFVRFPNFPPFAVSSPARPLAVMEGLWEAERDAVLLALFVVGVLEFTVLKQDYMERAPGEIGDFGAIAKPVDEDEWEKVQMAELKHGRLAMLAVLGCFAQEMVTGEGPVEQLFTGNINPFRDMDLLRYISTDR